MASIAELEYSILKGKQSKRAKENQLSRTRAPEATTQNTLTHDFSHGVVHSDAEFDFVEAVAAKAAIKIIIFTTVVWTILIWIIYGNA